MVKDFGALFVPTSVLIHQRFVLALKNTLFCHEGGVFSADIYDILAYQVAGQKGCY
jgi:hypothetical protein